MIEIRSGVIDERTWTDFVKVLDGTDKLLQCHYSAAPWGYQVFAVDNSITHYCSVYTPGSEPVNSSAQFISDNATAYGTFTEEYMYGSNKRIVEPTFTKASTIGNRIFQFTHNFCDPTTWYGDSVQVVNESLGTGDGSTTVFNTVSNHVTVNGSPVVKSIIDTSHGKITDENNLVAAPQGLTTPYVPKVTVNGATMTERAWLASSGGDYTIDYTTGAVTFFTAPASGAAVAATYFYENGSTQYIIPPYGYTNVIEMIELLFTDDFALEDEIQLCGYSYDPTGTVPPPGLVPVPTTDTVIKHFDDFINWTSGAFPAFPVLGSSARMHTHQYYQLRVEYNSPMVLNSLYGAQFRFWMTNHIPCGGTKACFTGYGYSELS